MSVPCNYILQISCALVALGTIIWYMAAVAEGDRGQDQDQDHDSRNRM